MFFFAPPEPVDIHQDRDVVVVTAPFRQKKDAINQGVIVINRDHALEHSMDGGIGETLKGHAGIRSTFFGPNASRPIIRGLGEDRIRILSNGLVGIDASTISADHAVAIDGLSAQQIEVLMGPAALRYGSNAVGGVINIIDGRLPDTLPTRTFSGDIFAGYTSGNDGKVASGNVKYKTGNFVFRLDGITRDTEDYDIPSFAQTSRLREITGDTTKGKATNSYGKLNEYGVSGAYVGDRANLAIAFKNTDSEYGVPNEESYIDLQQKRYDLQGGFKFDSFISALNYAISYGDYKHSEIEDGESAADFRAKGYDSRIELRHRKVNNLEGIWGIQYTDRDVSALTPEHEEGHDKDEHGEDDHDHHHHHDYLLPVTIKNTGIFGIERYENEYWGTEIGARYENIKYSGESGNREFDGNSFSISGFVKPIQGVQIALTLAKTDRIPTEVELFANGPHHATQTFDRGVPTLKKETANSIELSMGYRYKTGNISINFWNADYDDFINFTPTGAIHDDLPVYVALQKDAVLKGFELQMVQQLGQVGGHDFKGDIAIDYVRGRYDDGNIARIPPVSVNAGLEMEKKYITTRLEWEYIAKQDKIAEFETDTPSANVFNASFTYRPEKLNNLALTIAGKNLTDEDVREHTSPLKEYLPRMGRSINLSVHYKY